MTNGAGPAESGGDFVAEAQKILYNVAKDLREAFEDLTAVVVVTAAADTNAQIKLALKDVEFNNEIASNVKSMALTRMELDGDVYSMIPTKGNDPETRAEVMTEHKQNIALATQNWNNFIEGVLKVVQIGAKLANVDVQFEGLTRPTGSVHPALTR